MSSQPIQFDEDDYAQIRDELFIPYRPATQKQRSDERPAEAISSKASSAENNLLSPALRTEPSPNSQS